MIDSNKLEHCAQTPQYLGQNSAQVSWEGPKLTGSAYPKVRWSARRALRSRGDTGRFERGLVSRRAREAEKRDGEVRFPVRPFLRELELALPSLRFTSGVFLVESTEPNAVRPAPRYFITTTTCHSSTLPPGTSRSLCLRSLKPAEDKDRASRSRRGASLCSSTDADGMPPCSNEWP